MRFTDRRQAGRLLAEKLSAYRGNAQLVLGLARGGVAVAAEVAASLKLPLDVLVIKKIPSPADPELAIGALAPDGVTSIDWKFAHRVGADEHYTNGQIARLSSELQKKLLIYRKGRKPLEVKGKTVIIVDDGAATGATMEAAVAWLKKKHAGKIVVALPVVPSDFSGKIKPEVTELIVLATPPDFYSVGQFYETFGQVEDEEVIKLLER